MGSRTRLAAGTFTILAVGATVWASLGHGMESGDVGTLPAQPATQVRFATATPNIGLATWTLRSGGVDRRYSVYVPERWNGRQPFPVVVDIHGTGSNPEEELEVSGMTRAAEERGFVVILPLAWVPHPNGGAGWNIPPDAHEVDDVRYVADVLDDASRRLDLDTRRVFVTGFSGGARLACEVASRLSDRIAALGAVGGLRAPSGTGRPVPVIAFHGTGDPVNPYAGGGPDYWRYGVSEALQGWVARNRCVIPSDTLRVAAGVRCIRGGDCSGEGEIRLYVLDGVGHVWPGSHIVLPSGRFGRSTDAVDATSVMLDFFAGHPLPHAR